MIAGERLFSRFDEHLTGLRVETLPTKFAAIATDLSTGHEIWLRRGNVNDAVRASSAIPGIVRPVKFANETPLQEFGEDSYAMAPIIIAMGAGATAALGAFDYMMRQSAPSDTNLSVAA